MRLRGIVCRNFGGIGATPVAVALTPPISTLVGPCGSGKTTLLRTLQATCMLLEDWLEFLRTNLDERKWEQQLVASVNGRTSYLKKEAMYMFLLVDDATPNVSDEQQQITCFGLVKGMCDLQFTRLAANLPEPGMFDVTTMDWKKCLCIDPSDFLFKKTPSHWLNTTLSSEVISSLLAALVEGLVLVSQDHGLRDRGDVFNQPEWHLTHDRILTACLSPVACQFIASLVEVQIDPTRTTGSTNSFSKLRKPHPVSIGTIEQLSAGEADAVFCIAALYGYTIAGRPKHSRIILLDEPGQNLGAHQRSLFRRQMQVLAESRHNSSNTSIHIIMITHHVEMLDPPTLPAGILRFTLKTTENSSRNYRRRAQHVITVRSYPAMDEMKQYYQRLDHLELYFANGVIIVEGRKDVETLYAFDLCMQSLQNYATHLKDSNDLQGLPLQNALDRLGASGFGGIDWKIVNADGCAFIRKKAALCRQMQLDFLCLYDFDFLCIGSSMRQRMYPRDGPDGSVSSQLSHMGGHALNAMDMASFKHQPISASSKSGDSSSKQLPYPPIVHLTTSVLFWLMKFIPIADEQNYKGDEQLYNAAFEISQKSLQWDESLKELASKSDVANTAPWPEVIQHVLLSFMSSELSPSKVLQILRETRDAAPTSSCFSFCGLAPEKVASSARQRAEQYLRLFNSLQQHPISNCGWHLDAANVDAGPPKQCSDKHHISRLRGWLLFSCIRTYMSDADGISFASIAVERQIYGWWTLFKILKAATPVSDLLKELTSLEEPEESQRFRCAVQNCMSATFPTFCAICCLDQCATCTESNQHHPTHLFGCVPSLCTPGTQAQCVLDVIGRMSQDGCGQPDYLVWPPAVADIEGMMEDKSTIIVRSDPGSAAEMELLRATFLAWKFRERRKLAQSMQNIKSTLGLMSVADKLQRFETLFPKDRPWNWQSSPVLAAQCLLSKLRRVQAALFTTPIQTIRLDSSSTRPSER